MKQKFKLLVELLIVASLLVLVYLEFREYGLWVLIEAYAGLKILSLVLGLIYARKAKKKNLHLRAVFLLLVCGGVYLNWILSTLLFYDLAGKRIVRSNTIARWETKMSSYLV